MRCVAYLYLTTGILVLGKDFEDVDVSKAIFETVILQEISPNFNKADLTSYYANLLDQQNDRLKNAKAHLLTVGAFDANYHTSAASGVVFDCYHPPRGGLKEADASKSYNSNVHEATDWLLNTHSPKTHTKSGFVAAAIALSDPAVGFSPPETKDFQRIRTIALITSNKSEIASTTGSTSGVGVSRPFSVLGPNDCESGQPTATELSLLLKIKDAYLLVVAPEGEVADSYDAVCNEIDEGRCSVAARSQIFNTHGTELLDEIVDVGEFIIDDDEGDGSNAGTGSSSSTDKPSGLSTVTVSTHTTSSSALAASHGILTLCVVIMTWGVVIRF